VDPPLIKTAVTKTSQEVFANHKTADGLTWSLGCVIYVPRGESYSNKAETTTTRPFDCSVITASVLVYKAQCVFVTLLVADKFRFRTVYPIYDAYSGSARSQECFST